MGLFKDVKKPMIREVVAGAAEVSPLRPRFVPKAPPCAGACPNGNEIRDVMVTIAQAEAYGLTREQALERAWNRVVERNPFPAITGRICPHPCEAACNRSAKDGSVAFNAIERVIGDFGIANKLKLSRLATQPHTRKVAVIGAGPAGLSCAYQLARRGYAVTIFETMNEAGGMLRYGIPDFRLSREVIDAEIGRILDLGVELKCNRAVGKDISLEQLREEYAAVFTGIGAQEGIRLRLPGEDASNVLSGVSFLKSVHEGKKTDAGDKVVVVGAGGTACDVARVSKRLGAEVTIVGLEMTAARSAESAQKEGVRIEYAAMPLEILRRNGQATGVRFVRVTPETADSDASHAVPIAGSEFDLEASSVIIATRQRPDFRGLEILPNGNGTIKIDEWGRTTVDGVFAGGDVAGLGMATAAIAQGRLAAEAIDARFQERPLEKPLAPPVITTEKIKLDWYPAAPRYDSKPVSAEHAIGNGTDVGLTRGLTEDELLAEAKRCMSCGMCMDCETCWMYCSNNCFVRLPKGEHSKIKLEICNGCKKCAEACPSGYIEMS